VAFVSWGSVPEPSKALKVHDRCLHPIGNLEEGRPVTCREGIEAQKRSPSGVDHQVDGAAVFAIAVLAIEDLQSVVILGEKRMGGSLLETYGPQMRNGDGADRASIVRRFPASERVIMPGPEANLRGQKG